MKQALPWYLTLPFLDRCTFSALSSVLHDLADQLSILDVTPELLRDRALGVIAILVFRRQVDVDARALAGEDFCVRAVLRQVDLGRINLVQQDCG
jgi:hypothetical protein